MKTITIIGAGIGGLTLGIALKQKGFQVKVYEAASEIKTVGAGIILGCNAMQVYQKLGIDGQLAEKGNVINGMSITDNNLKSLNTISLDYFVEKYKISNYAIHRAALHRVLLNQFEQGEVIFGKRFERLNEDRQNIEFQDGSNVSYEILIGADGLNSRVRASIFGDKTKIRKAGQTCWRGIVDYKLPESFKHKFREAWGIGSRVGHGQINDHQVYWFALVNSEEPIESFETKDWKSEFKIFDPLLQDLIYKTDDDKIHVGQMTDLELLPKWHKNEICLIGDAAHAMTPNMGQGAGQAIEDGLSLANELAKYSNDHQKAFTAFQSYRKKKVDKIVKNSWRIGNIAQLESHFWSGFRNAGIRITPAFMGRQALKETFTI